MNSETTMLVRFDVRRQPVVWRVVDRRTGEAAAFDGIVAEQLDEEEAGEIADLLNTLEFLRRGVAVH
jgi:hypothetical protein